MESLRAIPGVEEVAFANQLPLKGCCWATTIYVEGRSLEAAAAERTSLAAVSDGYFRTMRIPDSAGTFLQGWRR